MAVPVWPVTLPQKIDGASFTFSLGDNRREMKTDNGGSVHDRERSGAQGATGGRMLMTPAQWRIMLLFYQSTLSDGVLDFDFPDHVNGDGSPHRLKFAAPPSVAREIGPDLWEVPLSFLVLR